MTTQLKEKINISVEDLNKLSQVISSHASNCARKLRKERSCCSMISVFLSTNPFNQKIKQYHAYKKLNLDIPTNDSIEIIKFALKGLEEIYRSDCIYKKAGVIVGRIIPDSQVQLSLFNKIDRNKRKEINSIIDNINNKIGVNKVKIAIQGLDRKWKLKQEKLSPCYTTRFTDILEVKL